MTTEIDTLPEVLTTAQACELLNLHRHTLSGLVHDGRIPVLRVGRQTWRFSKTRLLEIVASGGLES